MVDRGFLTEPAGEVGMSIWSAVKRFFIGKPEWEDQAAWDQFRPQLAAHLAASFSGRKFQPPADLQPLTPAYYVFGHGGWYIADPQPISLFDANMLRAATEAENKQLKFLLSCAPIIDMNPDCVRRSTTPYAYIHPKTLAKLRCGQVRANFVKFPGSPTVWILTSLMPEDRVIFSQSTLPGLEQSGKKAKAQS